jgi:hypothetical protein
MINHKRVHGDRKSRHNHQASEDRPLRQRSEITIRLLWICIVIAATGCAGWQPSRMASRQSFQQPQSYAATGIKNELAGTTPVAGGGNIVRGQDSQYSDPLSKQDPGSSQFMRHRMPITQAQYAPATAPSHTAPAPYSTATVPTESAPAQPFIAPGPQEVIAAPPGQPYVDIDPTMSTPLDVFVEETQTGRFMFGAGVNSDAGVTGQIVIDERNFDITRVPTSFQDFVNGTAFRGAGQGFRLEAMPGNLVQRYLISFTEPYLFNTRVSFNSRGFLYDRRFYDWDERRAGFVIHCGSTRGERQDFRSARGWGYPTGRTHRGPRKERTVQRPIHADTRYSRHSILAHGGTSGRIELRAGVRRLRLSARRT